MLKQNLQSLSDLLENNQYFFADKPSSLDTVHLLFWRALSWSTQTTPTVKLPSIQQLSQLLQQNTIALLLPARGVLQKVICPLSCPAIERLLGVRIFPSRIIARLVYT
ncbi:hypothetical protein A9R01_07765 ['Osedax' symbiont bacterium Rs2_46_30_T18]|nr:hypothetical protein A9R01_07765 ['Osedax' symbiont bacterium Rs2_46_30_T18]